MQGLRDVKALLDEGILSEQEFMREKETLLQREERIFEASWQLNPTNLIQEHTLFREARGGKRAEPDTPAAVSLPVLVVNNRYCVQHHGTLPSCRAARRPRRKRGWACT